MISKILFILEFPLYFYYVFIRGCTSIRLSKSTLEVFRIAVNKGNNAFRLKNDKGKLLPACQINYVGFERLYFKVVKDVS